MRQIAAAVGSKPLIANYSEHGKTPLLTAAETAEVGFAVCLYPTTSLFAAARSDLAELFAAMGVLGFGVGGFSAAMPGVILAVTPKSETSSAMSFNYVVRSVGSHTAVNEGRNEGGGHMHGHNENTHQQLISELATIRELARRTYYGFDLKKQMWEVGNEPDYKVDYKVTADEYAEQFNKAHDALVKAGLRENVVLCGPVSSQMYWARPVNTPPVTPYIETFLAKCAHAVDIIDVHSYCTFGADHEELLGLTRIDKLDARFVTDRPGSDKVVYDGMQALIDKYKKKG